MSKRGLVSVIIPTYNPDNYIFKTIESVLNQTYKKIEVIVVDDGSERVDTQNLLKDYINNGKINHFKKQNGGPGSARNFGVWKSNGEYLAFLDDDDEWYTDKIEKQIDIAENQGYDIVIGNCYNLHSDGTRTFRNNSIPEKKESIIKSFFYGYVSNITPSMFVSRRVFDKIGGFDEFLKTKEDHLLMMNAVRYGKIYLIKEPVYTRNKRDDSFSIIIENEEQKKHIDYFINKVKKEFDFITEKDVKKLYSQYDFASAYKNYENGKRLKSLQYLIKSLKKNPSDKKNYILLFFIIIPLPSRVMIEFKEKAKKFI